MDNVTCDYCKCEKIIQNLAQEFGFFALYVRLLFLSIYVIKSVEWKS